MTINIPREKKEFEEKVVEINRTSKKTKGGNQIGFTALMVVGDKKGRVGTAFGKAKDVLSAIKKGTRIAKKNIIDVSTTNGTIPHKIYIKQGATKILFKPAPPGTGIIAVFCAFNGAKVTATDINPHAVENCKLNSERFDLKNIG